MWPIELKMDVESVWGIVDENELFKLIATSMRKLGNFPEENKMK